MEAIWKLILQGDVVLLGINLNILVHSWAFGQCQLTLGMVALHLFFVVACVFFGETHNMLTITMSKTEINSLLVTSVITWYAVIKVLILSC
jgi:hypothetical protein